MIKQIDDQLPEWAKNSPNNEETFEIDFGSPDKPKKIQQRFISDEEVNLEPLQIYDIVESKNVIALIDRRGGNCSRTPINQEEEIENKSVGENKENEINIGDFVLMVRGKAICSGSKQFVVEKLASIADEDEHLTEDNVVILKREPVFVLFENNEAD